MADALGFPDATDTGVSAGVTLKTYNGDLVITTPGAVISGLDIKGNVYINAPNVTLVDCKITGTGYAVVNIKTGITGTTVENCEINGTGNGPQGQTGIGGSGTFIGNNIYNVENGINVEASNTLIQDNYIHDLKASAGNSGHYDGIAIQGGFSNVTVRHNTVIAWDTSCVFIDNDFGPLNNIVVDNNKLIGQSNGANTAYTIYVIEKAGNPAQVTNVQVTNNYMTKGTWGFVSIDRTEPTWSNNIDLSTNKLISSNNSLSSAPVSNPPASSVPLAISSFSNDTGVAGDKITSDNTLTLTGTAAANSSVKIMDGSTQIGTATSNSSGAWSYTTSALSDGAHSLTVKDSAGKTSTALSVTIDTKAPTVPTMTSMSNDTGVSGDKITSDNTLTLSGAAEANSKVAVYDGGKLLGTTTANSSGAWSYTTAALSDGAHNLTATATDTAGNASAASAAMAVTIDTAAPGKPVISSNTVNSNKVALTGTAEANSTVKIYDGSTLLGSATANGSGAWTYTTAALSNGGHNLIATATDVAGNVSTNSTALSVTIGSSTPTPPTPPTTPAPAPAKPVISSFSNDSGVVGDFITNDNTLTLTGTAAANSTITLYDAGKALGTTTADSGGAWSYTTAALSNGGHNLTATAANTAGTSAASSVLAVTIDTTAPNKPIISSFSNDSGVAGDHITNDSTLTLVGTAEANSKVSVFDQGKLLGTATANGSGAWSYTTATLSNGAHSLTATAADVAGNASAASTALAVTIDTLAPNKPVFSTNSVNANKSVALTGTAEANSTIKIYDGGSLLGSTTTNDKGGWSYTTSALGSGNHNLTATATDVAGNASATAGLSLSISTPSVPQSRDSMAGASALKVAAPTTTAVTSLAAAATVDSLPTTQNVYSDLAKDLAQASQSSNHAFADHHHSSNLHSVMMHHLTKFDWHSG